jgi:crotonobetainyl-CoA:carnitine CoA-transferase CaiB-like acyl-CoA transferase
LQAQVFMLDFQGARWTMDREVPGQAGNNHPTSIPTGVFKTKDGHINIAVAGNSMWQKFKVLLGDPEIESDDYKDMPARRKNRDKLNALIERHTVKDTSADWIERLNETGIPSGEINDMRQVFESPQVQHLGLVQEFVSQERGPSQILGQPILMSRSRSGVRRPPPKLGQHTDEILGEAGYKPADIAKLRKSGAI